jgi:hypothetical protein
VEILFFQTAVSEVKSRAPGRKREKSIDRLERGLSAHSPSMFWLKTDARFDGLRSSPRYAELARQLPW